MPSKKKRKNSLWAQEELKKEEVRGVFAIGIIATLVSIRIAGFSFIKVNGANLLDILLFPLFFWVLYLILMGIGLSDDIWASLGPGVWQDLFYRLTKSCKHWARIFFALGVIILFIIYMILAIGMAANWPRA